MNCGNFFVCYCTQLLSATTLFKWFITSLKPHCNLILALSKNYTIRSWTTIMLEEHATMLNLVQKPHDTVQQDHEICYLDGNIVLKSINHRAHTIVFKDSTTCYNLVTKLLLCNNFIQRPHNLVTKLIKCIQLRPISQVYIITLSKHLESCL